MGVGEGEDTIRQPADQEVLAEAEEMEERQGEQEHLIQEAGAAGPQQVAGELALQAEEAEGREL